LEQTALVPPVMVTYLHVVQWGTDRLQSSEVWERRRAGPGSSGCTRREGDSARDAPQRPGSSASTSSSNISVDWAARGGWADDVAREVVSAWPKLVGEARHDPLLCGYVAIILCKSLW